MNMKFILITYFHDLNFVQPNQLKVKHILKYNYNPECVKLKAAVNKNRNLSIRIEDSIGVEKK